MIVKKNQRRLWDDLALYVPIPPIPADEEVWDQVQPISKGPGRIAVRRLECGSGMGDELD